MTAEASGCRLHPYSVSDRALESVVNARVELLVGSNVRPYYGIVVDGHDTPAFVYMTGGDMDLAQRLLTPICDALNAHDIALYREMLADIQYGEYERKLDAGMYDAPSSHRRGP